MTDPTGAASIAREPGKPGPFPGRRSTLIIGIWAVWSISIMGLATAIRTLPMATASGWSAELTSAAPPLARWDAGWYYSIAADGYRYDRTVSQNNVGFYPLYPLLMRWLHRLIHVPLFTAGTVISMVSLLGSLLLMGELADDRAGLDSALPAVCALLFFPSAFFLLAVYTESLFLFTVVSAFWAARRRRWLLAGAAGALASLTRFNGFLIIVPLAWLAWEDSGRRFLAIRWRPAAAVLVAIGGGAVFPIFLWHRFGDPLLYVHSKIQGWPQRPMPVWSLISTTLSDVPGHLRIIPGGAHLGYWLNLATAILFTILTALLFRSRFIPEALYCASNLLLLFSTGTLFGLQRYVLVLFPCFYLLARVRRFPVAAFAYAFAGSCAGTLLLTRFVHWLFAE